MRALPRWRKVGRSLDLEPERWRLRLNTDAAREAAREWVHDHQDERGTAICWATDIRDAIERIEATATISP